MKTEPRPATGPMVFGEDYTGVFIRGDSAFSYAQVLESLLHVPGLNEYKQAMVRDLHRLLASSREVPPRDTVQALRPFNSCLLPVEPTT